MVSYAAVAPADEEKKLIRNGGRTEIQPVPIVNTWWDILSSDDRGQRGVLLVSLSTIVFLIIAPNICVLEEPVLVGYVKCYKSLAVVMHQVATGRCRC